MSRGAYLAAAALVILAGLVLRLVPWGLPLRVHHVGGGILWGAMLFLLAAALRPRGWGERAALAAAFLAATAIELFRLYRSPGLDAFRLTLAGQLLLGRIFSAWNLLSYAAGIALAFLTARRIGAGRP
ncbi:DUF2809 domain-containing protein [Methylobacterium oxalidis]|uniref:DUF2809 domain-containing protein n=1 Tax=Methylobacterium oxalidis TaxID=944322 RepID=A0A512IWH3_9HYPH|nr:DUF2809 domain-containing protein [Methylobacterium oxalidis]GEP02068.1 hypothetical protein MOX02_01060 [Methylobacterium oxalidis]GJE31877.1 hypothetical protein LDDCCGHA_2059 [Methylobacterium oxalidis]GLS62013.1 hypothetical protein GCM10007888_03940 [Methylobacterium oxalidis]